MPKPEQERPDKPPGDQPPIPSNVAIEDAARPFVEQFERARGAGPIHRQGGLVGSDFVATDGRYIEVKATGGTASDSFDLEPSEWHVALDPATQDRFWVYIVEHLNDGREPTVAAIRNPVRDSNLGHHPVGKMRVVGWRSSQHLETGRAVDSRSQRDGDGGEPADWP